MPVQAMQHAGNADTLGLPMLHQSRLGITEIQHILTPEFCLIDRTQRHHEIATKFSLRPELPAITLRKEGRRPTSWHA
jgi:hypothetical protein